MKLSVLVQMSKIMLMPLLLGYYLTMQTETGIFPLLVTAALIADTAGDAFLLSQNHRSFIAGSVSFSFGHIMYITYMFMHLHAPYLMIPVFILSFYPYYKAVGLAKKTSMKLLVCLYSGLLGILVMACCASGSLLASIGSVFFVLSDSMLGLNLVKQKYSPIPIMCTYIIAQLFIISGILSLQGAL